MIDNLVEPGFATSEIVVPSAAVLGVWAIRLSKDTQKFAIAYRREIGTEILNDGPRLEERRRTAVESGPLFVPAKACPRNGLGRN